jgi:hypothetical protein
MRNILEHPITDKERIDTLEDIKNEILAQDTVGDLRAAIVQECIDMIKSHGVTIQLAADDLAKNKIDSLQHWYKEQQHRARENVLSTLALLGFKPGMWTEYADDPPPLNTYQNGTDVVVLAILDALTQEGICAWNGKAISCVSQIIYAQIYSRKRLIVALEKIVLNLSDTDDLREIAIDAINYEKSKG